MVYIIASCKVVPKSHYPPELNAHKEHAACLCATITHAGADYAAKDPALHAAMGPNLLAGVRTTASADMSNCFKLDSCLRIFHQGYKPILLIISCYAAFATQPTQSRIFANTPHFLSRILQNTPHVHPQTTRPRPLHLVAPRLAAAYI